MSQLPALPQNRSVAGGGAFIFRPGLHAFTPSVHSLGHREAVGIPQVVGQGAGGRACLLLAAQSPGEAVWREINSSPISPPLVQRYPNAGYFLTIPRSQRKENSA